MRWKQLLCSNHYYLLLTALLLLPVTIAEMNVPVVDEELPDFGTIPTPPSFIHEPNDPLKFFVVQSDIPAQKGSTGSLDSLKKITLHCRASAYPKPQYRWLKNGREFGADDTIRISKIPGEGTIIINKLIASDAATYQCTAENGNGTAYDREVELRQTYTGYFDTVEPRIYDIELGEPFSTKCVAPKTDPESKVFWLLKGESASSTLGPQFTTVNSSHISVDDKGTIYFSYVDDEDKKHPQLFYTCAVVNPITNDYKFGQPFGINVLKTHRTNLDSRLQIPPQEMYTNDGELYALLGKSISMFCIFSGHPVRSFTPEWRKEKGEIDWIRTNSEANHQKSILIENVQFEDEGRYTCSFKFNPNLNRVFNLHVEAAPFWRSNPPVNQNASEGDTVKFICDAVGLPQPIFTFYKNGEILKSDGSRIFIRGNMLEIVSLRKSTPLDNTGDNAVYQCKAENKHGMIWANFYLNILSFKPFILVPPGIVNGLLDDKIQLRCRVFGSPLPAIEWHGENLEKIPRHRISESSENGGSVAVLTIYKTDGTEQGEYECRAHNKYGNAAAYGTLKLRKPTTLTQSPSDTVVIAGASVILPCKALTDPDYKLQLSWMFNGEPLRYEDRRLRLTDQSLTIEKATKLDSGSYTCLAKTEWDNTTKTATLSVKDVPAAPTDVWVQCASESRSAVVHWGYSDDQADFAPVENFRIEHNCVLEPNVWQPAGSDAHRDATQLSVSLPPYGTYRFRVVARNEVGDSPPSIASLTTCTTPAGPPDRNPKNVEFRSNSPNDLTVFWEPMTKKEWNGPDLRYMIKYRPEDDPNPEWSTYNVTDPTVDYAIIETDITGPYKSYEVQVQAVNSMGVSLEVPKIYIGESGEGVPEETPKGFRCVDKPEPTKAIFEWERVNEESMNGRFVGYKVSYWSDSKKRHTDRKETIFSRYAQSGTIYDLKPFARNYAYIQAINGANAGPPSPIINFTMDEGVPDPVANLLAFAVSDSVVGVVWNQPKETNGVLWGYEVGLVQVDENGVKTVSNTERKAVIPEPYANHYRGIQLEPNSKYRVTLVGLTKKGSGRGEPSSYDVKTLPVHTDKTGETGVVTYLVVICFISRLG